MGGKLHLLRSTTRPSPRPSDVEVVSEARQDTFLCTCRPCGKCMEARYEGRTEQTGAS